MDNLTEVLGQYKSTANSNVDLSTRLILEQPSSNTIETNLFLEISQDSQFILEKQSSNNFRIYGKINPIINTNPVNKSSKPVAVTPITINKNLLDFTNQNWSVVLLQPIQDNGFKGQKILNNVKNDVTYDLNNGLPALTKTQSLKDNTAGFLLYLGHNFSQGDSVYITNTDPNNAQYLGSGIYEITSVNGNLITVNASFNYNKFITPTKVYSPLNNVALMSAENGYNNIKVNVSPKKLQSFLINNTQKVSTTTTNTLKFSIRNIDFNFTPVDIENFVSNRPSIYKVAKPSFFIRKIQNNEILEYYVKKAQVLAVLDNFDDCAFSQSTYGSINENFIFKQTINTDLLRDNLNYPLNNLYIGVFKNGSTSDATFGDVEANFYNLIEFTTDSDGFEMVSPAKTTLLASKPKVGDIHMISLCEYSLENLTETEITPMYHRFIHNDVLFHYNPFTNITIKHLSSYVETGNNVLNMPDYASYSLTKKTYLWRDLYDIGVADENGVTVDFPFMNNSYYVFDNINFILNIEKNKTTKYDLNINDISQADLLNNGGINDLNNLINDLNSITDTLIGDTTNQQNLDNNPFQTYTDKPC
jgi:hypothetical protein